MGSTCCTGWNKLIHVSEADTSFFRAFLTREQKVEFEEIVKYFNQNLYPLARDLAFLLGFYVKVIVTRWWNQFNKLPWPDTLALQLQGLVLFESEEALDYSHRFMRYVILSYVLCIRRISKVCSRMEKTLNHFSCTGSQRHLSQSWKFGGCSTHHPGWARRHGTGGWLEHCLVDSSELVHDHDKSVGQIVLIHSAYSHRGPTVFSIFERLFILIRTK